MPAMDELMSNVKQWFDESKSSGLSAVANTREGIGEGNANGMSKEMMANSQAYYQYAFKAETDLQALMKKRNIGVGKGLDQLKKDYKMKLDTNKIEHKDYVRYTKTLNLMKKQVSIERKIGLMKKAAGKDGMGKTGKGMANKISSSGTKGGKAGGMVGTAIAVVYVAYKGIMSLTHSFFKGLENAFDRGIAGILMNVVNTVTGIISIVNKDLAKIVGVFGSLLVKSYMKQLEVRLATKSTTMQMRGHMGMQPGTRLPGKQNAFNMFGGTSKKMGEWAVPLASIGKNLTEVNNKFTHLGINVGEQMQAIGLNLGINAQQTAEYFDKALGFSSKISDAMKGVSYQFGVAREASQATGISTIKLSKWISDASVQARMMNVDFKSVSNSLTLMKDAQKDLGKMGIDLRSQGAEMLKQLTGVGKQWDLATHAYFGMTAHAKDYRKESGKQLDAEKAILMSMWGYRNAMNSYIDTAGNLKFKDGKGPSDENVLVSRLLAIKGVQSKIAKEKGAVAAYMYGKQIAKLPDYVNKLIMRTDEGSIKNIAKQQEVKTAFDSSKDIQAKIMTIAEHQEQIQLKIGNMMQKMVAIVMHGIMKMITEIQILGTYLGGDKYMRPEYKKESAHHGTRMRALSMQVMKQVSDLNKSYGKDAVKWATGSYTPYASKNLLKKTGNPLKKQHSGGSVLPGSSYIGRMASGLRTDEYLFASKSPAFMMRQDQLKGGAGSQTTNQAGNTYNLIFNIPDADASTIAGKVYQHLSAQYQA